MAMSRKHCEAVATVVQQIHQDYGDEKDVLFTLAMKALAGRLATVYQIDSERFDRKRFMEACGFNE